jgi:hypothetical protein
LLVVLITFAGEKYRISFSQTLPRLSMAGQQEVELLDLGRAGPNNLAKVAFRGTRFLGW